MPDGLPWNIFSIKNECLFIRSRSVVVKSSFVSFINILLVNIKKILARPTAKEPLLPRPEPIGILVSILIFNI